MVPSTGGTSIQQQDAISTFSATGLDTAGVTGAIEFSVTTTYKRRRIEELYDQESMDRQRMFRTGISFAHAG
jgi:hypothetical protein